MSVGRARKTVLAALAGAAVLSSLTATAGPAGAAADAPSPTGTYRIAATSGTYLIGGRNLFPDGADDAVAAVTLPFRPYVYGKQRPTGTVYVSSNGNVQFGPSPSAAYANSCLPASPLSGPAMAVYWDDLRIRPYPETPDGVYTKAFGRAPNRSYAISWRGVDYATGNTAVRAEIVFYEGRQYFDMIYSDGDGFGTTIGVQTFDRTKATQYLCKPARHNVVVPGTKLRYTYS